MIQILFVITLIFSSLSAGEIDGKGLVCKIYGDSLGYYFEEGRAFEYKLRGGEEKLELIKTDIGKYHTNENAIFIGEIKIDRKKLEYQRFSSFRGKCKAYNSLELLKKSLNIKNLTKGNKI